MRVEVVQPGMQVGELRSKKTGELTKLLSELRNELQQMRFDLAAGRVKNIREIRSRRRTIAKIKTVLAEQEAVR